MLPEERGDQGFCLPSVQEICQQFSSSNTFPVVFYCLIVNWGYGLWDTVDRKILMVKDNFNGERERENETLAIPSEEWKSLTSYSSEDGQCRTWIRRLFSTEASDGSNTRQGHFRVERSSSLLCPGWDLLLTSQAFSSWSATSSCLATMT